LSGTDFENCLLNRVNFKDSNCKNADFEDTRMRGCDFRRANTQGADFEDADVEDTKGLEFGNDDDDWFF
jgi:uncharacterized protein YjbI with pentapeptide repeats